MTTVSGPEVGQLRDDNRDLTQRLVEVSAEVTRLRESLATAQQQLTEMSRLRGNAVQELVNFKTRVRDRMIVEAENRDWCSEFDQILVEFGMEPRTGNYEVRFEVAGSVTLTLLARGEDHASELAIRAVRFFDGQQIEDGDQTLTLYSVTVDEVTRS